MKLKFSILSLSAAVLLMTACEPRDSKITRPDTRAKTDNTPTPAAGVKQLDGKPDNYKYIALLADRQVEAMELYRALTDAAYATAKNFVIEDVEIDGVKLKKVSSTITSLKTDKLEISRSLILAVTLTVDADGKLQKIEAKEIKDKLSTEKVMKTATNTDISLQNRSKHIVIQRAVDGSLNALVELNDVINTKDSGKSVMLNTLQFNFAATDANQDVFKVSAVKMSHERFGVQAGDFKMLSDAATTMTVEMRTADKCSAVSGVLHLNSEELRKDKSGPLYDRVLTYDATAVSVKAGNGKADGSPLDIPACESRLSVDLGKLF